MKLCTFLRVRAIISLAQCCFGMYKLLPEFVMLWKGLLSM